MELFLKRNNTLISLTDNHRLNLRVQGVRGVFLFDLDGAEIGTANNVMPPFEQKPGDERTEKEQLIARNIVAKERLFELWNRPLV